MVEDSLILGNDDKIMFFSYLLRQVDEVKTDLFLPPVGDKSKRLSLFNYQNKRGGRGEGGEVRGDGDKKEQKRKKQKNQIFLLMVIIFLRLCLRQ